MASQLSVSMQLANHLCIFISEHKWDDALKILPAVILQLHSGSDANFVWKAVHIIMIHKHFPRDAQLKILMLIFQSGLQHYQVALEWFTESLLSVDHSDIELISQIVRKHMTSRKSIRYGASLFEAYVALYHYLQWNEKYNELTGDGTYIKDINNPTTEEKEHLRFGLKTIDLLNKSISSLVNCNLLDTEENNTKDITSKRKNLLCEWIIAPLLDIEEKMSNSEAGYEALIIRYGVKKTSGFEIVEEYTENHEKHLPALKFYYGYFLKVYPNEKVKKLNILKKICALVPNESLVLTYVEMLLQTEFGDNFSNKSTSTLILQDEHRDCHNDRFGNNCFLNGTNISTLKECIELLTSFLEYNQWQKCMKGWNLLTVFLRMLVSAWTNCWKCEKCIKSRGLIHKHTEKLTLWPYLFWDLSAYPISLTKEEGKLLMCRAYSAFVFGYDADILKRVSLKLQSNDLLSEKINMLIQLEGPYSDNFLNYIQEKKNQGFKSELLYHIPNVELSDLELSNVSGMQVNSVTRNSGTEVMWKKEIDCSTPKKRKMCHITEENQIGPLPKKIKLMSPPQEVQFSSTSKKINVLSIKKNIKPTPTNDKNKISPSHCKEKICHTPKNKKTSLTPNKKKSSLTPNNKKTSLTPNNKKTSLTPKNKKTSLTPKRRKISQSLWQRPKSVS